MKCLQVIFLAFIICNTVPAIEVGSTISEIYNKNFTFINETGNSFPGFSDIEANLLTSNEESILPAFLIASQMGKPIAIYGVLDGIPPNSYFFIDSDGDGILDFKSKEPYYPNWVLFSAEMERSYPSEFLNDCNAMYKLYNRNQGPTQDELKNILSIFIEKSNNKKQVNRDIYFSFLNYIYGHKYKDIALSLIATTGRYIYNQFDKLLIPLILLYTGETYINSGDFVQASEYFELLLKLDKDSLIASFYLAKMKTILNNDNKYIEQFKQSNPSFWTLKKANN